MTGTLQQSLDGLGDGLPVLDYEYIFHKSFFLGVNLRLVEG
jgi:hypothetical protein